MTTLTRVQQFRIGLHAAGDYTTAPGSLKFLRPAGTTVFVGNDHEYVDRDDYATSDGHRLPGFRAGQALAVPDFSLERRGLSGDGADDGVNSDTLGMEDDEFLRALCGAAPVDAVGEATAASPGTGTAITADASITSTGVRARLILGADGKYHARVQTAASTTAMTIDRALRTDANGTLNPAASSDIYAGRMYTIAPNAPDAQHIYIDAEDAEARVRAYGCLMGGSFTFERAGRVLLNLSGITATSWDAPARAEPTYAAASRGLPIRVLASPLFIGADLYQATVDSFDFGLNITQRESDHAPNNAWGYVRSGAMPVLTGTIRAGTSTTPREVTAALLESLRSDGEGSLHDVLYQVGREPGRCMAIRIPAADLRLGKAQDANGQKVYAFEARATDGTAQIMTF